MRTEMSVIGGVGAAAIIGCCMVYSQGWGATQAVTEVPGDPIGDAVSQAALRLLTNPPCAGLVTDPCPMMLERLCGADPTGNGGMGGLAAMCDCACGNGWWTRAPISVSLSPGKPMNMHPISETINSVFWRWQLTEIAQPGHVEAGVEMFGLSSWWHAGSMTKRASARQATLIRELWLGTGIPCPRLVTIAAMGGAMLELSLTCSPSVGCTASGSATAVGSCSSVGRASADIVDKTVRGTVGYNSYSHTVVVDGDFGFAIADNSVGIDGKISKKVDWKLDGPGSVSGTAAYVVTPDRSYCAFTNRPIDLRSNGWAIATGAMSVDENGSTSMSALAIVGLTVQ
jgi:hypothetical protein